MSHSAKTIRTVVGRLSSQVEPFPVAVRVPGARSFRPRFHPPCILSRTCQPATRRYATTNADPNEYHGRRWFTFNQAVGTVAAIAAVLLGKQVYDWLFASAIWPETIREPLRKALKARRRGNLEEAERYFKVAIRAANAIPPSALEPDPLSKLTGLYIAFATLYEQSGRPVRAYEQYRIALEQLGESPLAPDPRQRKAGAWAAGRTLSEKDHIRAIGLNQKMGQVALQIESSSTVRLFPTQQGKGGPRSWLDAAEQHLTAALTAMLRLGLDRKVLEANEVITGRDIQLPDDDGVGDDDGGRVDKQGLGITMESLAEVHAKKGEYDLASQLLLQTISIILPPAADSPSVEDRCRAAQLMTSISSYAAHDGSPRAIKVGKSWSLRAMQIVEQAILDNGGNFDGPAANCVRAQGVGLYNLGMLAEMEGDVMAADDLLRRALTLSTEAGFHEGTKQAGSALKRLRAAESAAAPNAGAEAS